MDDEKITPKYGDHKESDDTKSPAINNTNSLDQQEQDAASSPVKDTDLAQESSSIPQTPSGGFYKGNMLKLAAGAAGKGVGKKGAIAGGAGLLVMLIIAFGAMFSFLNAFKLDGLMQNIDQKAFARFTGATDRRSNKWIASYIAVRLGEVENSRLSVEERTNSNKFFKATSVDTGRPFSDWYRTMRLSKFEADLFNKEGISFTSIVGENGKVRAGYVNINGEKPIEVKISQEDFDKISTINTATSQEKLKIFNQFQASVDTAVFNSDKEGRSAIKRAVKDNTHSWQVIKRRHIRKDIQNVTGIRDWRFFEKTRDKVDAKQIDMRNKLISKVFPEDTNSGKFVRCMFGMTDCSNFTNDYGNPETKASAPDPSGKDTSKDVSAPDPNGGVDDNGNVNKVVAEKLLAEDLAKVTKMVLAKGVPVLNVINIVSTLEQLKSVDTFIKTGKAVQLVSVAKGQQAAALYATMAIARDQMRTGEATPEEIGSFMELFSNASNSEGYAKVIDPSATVVRAEGYTVAKDKAAYCTPEHQEAIIQEANMAAAEKEFAWQCEDKRVGGESTAQTLTDGYNNTIGRVISPLVDAYSAVVDSSIIGGLIKGIASVIDQVIGTVLSAIIKPILSAIGIQDTLENIMGWVTSKIMAFMGGGPTLHRNSPSGQRFNFGLNGATVINNASMRNNGASSTTDQTKVLALNTASEYAIDNQPSFTDKYFAVSNPNSLISRNLFAIANNMNANLAVNFSKIIKGIGSTLTSPFSKSTKAAESPYAADEFSGVDTYDFPQQCYDLSPSVGTLEEGTNATQIFRKNDVIKPGEEDLKLTWDMVSNSDTWYQMLYQKVEGREDGGDIVKQIYNCHLLDNTVRGGLGALNGYTKDNGYADTSASSSTTTDTSSAPPTISGQWSWPVGGTIKINSCFAEPLSKGPHPGLDIQASYVPAYSPAAGTVYGNPGGIWGTLIIKHDGGLYSVFEHMDSISVKSGEAVTAGQQVGKTGNTAPPGGSSGPHLHFAVTTDPSVYEYADMGKGKIINPLEYLNNGQDYQQCKAIPRSA